MQIMDYYQGVVLEYLRADRAVFVNPECCIQLKEGSSSGGDYWYCDLLAVDLREKRAWLCEVSYAESLRALMKRLDAWKAYWPSLKKSLVRDCGVPPDWPVRPWLFIPGSCVKRAAAGVQRLGLAASDSNGMPVPRITTLEMVVPWSYTTWNRRGEHSKPDSIPPQMRE
jgi:hypothetical protein